MKCKLLSLSFLVLSLDAFAEPERPPYVRDVHMTEDRVYQNPTIPTLQTSFDGRIGLSHRKEQASAGSAQLRVAFRLMKPEKIGQPFVDSTRGSQILDRPNNLARASAVFNAAISNRITPGNNHMGLCDPTFNENSVRKNPVACGAGNNDDCYELVIISAPRVGAVRRLQSTPVTVQVASPKTTDARIRSVTAGATTTGASWAINEFLEPMVSGGGRLLTFRQGRNDVIPPWRNSAGAMQTNTRADAVYSVHDNLSDTLNVRVSGSNIAACDVSQWTQLYPITHAPYDDTINTRYGFAMNEFREPNGDIIPEGRRLTSYPWMDKNADNLSFAAFGLNFNAGSASDYPSSCVNGVSCNNSQYGQNVAQFSGRTIMGLWTHGKMVLLDNLINNIDFNHGSRDIDHRNLRLYSNGGAAGLVRAGNGRDNNRDRMPLSSAGNTSFIDSNEHRFNYLPNMRPVTPADVTWLMSSGRSTTEVPFDDYSNHNSFLNVNMTQLVEIEPDPSRTTPFFNSVSDNRMQNAATAPTNRWRIPAFGTIRGDGRIEPVANGGINGKGFWLDGSNTGLRFVVPTQAGNAAARTARLRMTGWHYSLFFAPYSDTGVRTLMSFPNGGQLRLGANNNSIQIFDGTTLANNLRTFNLPGAPLNIQEEEWAHLGIQIAPRNGSNRHLVTIYLNGNRINSYLSPANRPPFEVSAGNIEIGLGANDFEGWIDDVKIFAEESNIEVACNRANGTLIGLQGNFPNGRLRNIANRIPDGTHDQVRALVSGDAAHEYVCYQDYSSDLAVHLGNIPARSFSVREDINFPEGPLRHDRPRPNTLTNAFCLSCHTSDGLQGLNTAALGFIPGLNAIDDGRRQPLQPEANVYGVIPENWLGNNLPNRTIRATRANPFRIDACILNNRTSCTGNE